MIDYPDGFSKEWRDYMTYDKATDPDAGLKLDEIRETIFDSEEAFTLDFTSKKREGFTSTTDHAIRHEMQRSRGIAGRKSRLCAGTKHKRNLLKRYSKKN